MIGLNPWGSPIFTNLALKVRGVKNTTNTATNTATNTQGEIDANSHQHVSGYSRGPESPTQIQSTNKKRPKGRILEGNWIDRKSVV